MTTTRAANPQAAISQKQRRWLKGAAHPLKPVVTVGQAGLTEAVLAELDSSLEHHELLKVRVASADREARAAMVLAMSERAGAVLVGQIGHIAILYRPSRGPGGPVVLPAD